MAKIPEPQEPLELTDDAPAEQAAATFNGSAAAPILIYTELHDH